MSIIINLHRIQLTRKRSSVYIHQLCRTSGDINNAFSEIPAFGKETKIENNRPAVWFIFTTELGKLDGKGKTNSP